MATKEGMEGFIKWVKEQGDVIVAIEGSSGPSKPMEKALRSADIVFYSFEAANIDQGSQQAVEAAENSICGSVFSPGRRTSRYRYN